MIEDAIAAAIREVVREEIRAAVHPLTGVVDQILRALPSPETSIEDYARIKGLSVSGVRRGIKSGAIGARKVGRRVLVDLSARPLTEAEITDAARAARSTP